MNIKSGVQSVADRLKVESVTLLHAAEQRAHEVSLRGFVGHLAGIASGAAQKFVEQLEAVEAQGETNYSDQPDA